MAALVEKNQHNNLNGLVEVICALSSDPSILVENLRDDLAVLLTEFESKYAEKGFDPLLNAKWIKNQDEKEKFWDPIKREIDYGPVASTEIDKLKTSLVSESRTTHQEIVFQNFTEVEHRLFVISNLLCSALLNSDHIDGNLKKG